MLDALAQEETRRRQRFAEMVDQAMLRKGWGYPRLSGEIGRLPGDKFVGSSQLRRLRFGETRHLSAPLVQRLVEVLDLDPTEAWHAAGLWPPDLDMDGYRKVLAAARTSTRASGWMREFPARRPRIVPLRPVSSAPAPMAA